MPMEMHLQDWLCVPLASCLAERQQSSRESCRRSPQPLPSALIEQYVMAQEWP